MKRTVTVTAEADRVLAVSEAIFAERDELIRQRDRAEARADTLAERLCHYHDTDPLNETVAGLERERDALIAVAEERCPELRALSDWTEITGRLKPRD